MDHACSLVELLGLLVESSSLLDCNEALDAQSLPGLLDGGSPALDVGVGLLASCHTLLGHDLATLVLDQVGLGQASVGLGKLLNGDVRGVEARDVGDFVPQTGCELRDVWCRLRMQFEDQRKLRGCADKKTRANNAGHDAASRGGSREL